MGLAELDDAALVPAIDGGQIVFTVDFFTPIVDSAFDWGRIAAANALSDVYAMGGKPMWALNIVGWPVDKLSLETLAQVLEGGAAIAKEAGVGIVGGHTVDDPEPKYGMCVIGQVDRPMRIDAAKPGDRLVLTKPIGTGLIATAIKAGEADEAMITEATKLMTTLNDKASQNFSAANVKACTDVTGFGLAGHLHRMCLASGVAAEIDLQSIPTIQGATELARKGFVPGGTARNLEAVSDYLDARHAEELQLNLFADPQTSGGLLGCVRGDVNLPYATIGRIVEGPPGKIELR